MAQVQLLPAAPLLQLPREEDPALEGERLRAGGERRGRGAARGGWPREGAWRGRAGVSSNEEEKDRGSVPDAPSAWGPGSTSPGCCAPPAPQTSSCRAPTGSSPRAARGGGSSIRRWARGPPACSSSAARSPCARTAGGRCAGEAACPPTLISRRTRGKRRAFPHSAERGGRERRLFWPEGCSAEVQETGRAIPAAHPMMFLRNVVLPAEMFPSTHTDTRCCVFWPRSATTSCRGGGAGSGRRRRGGGRGDKLAVRRTLASCLRRLTTEQRKSNICCLSELHFPTYS